MKLSLPSSPSSPEDLMGHFFEALIEDGIEPYDHQEEAILEIFSGNNVILNTPTGSGKSLVALAMHYKSLAEGRTSYYTVPIKALANEKFLSLCQTFSPENVGMITGDASVNPTAPIICCTAEILANIALREGATASIHDVIMDEFHYYSDRDRGAAWQIPLLTLPQSRFLLMSATIGDTSYFEKSITELTGAETQLIQSEQRPVPLEFSYSTITLTEQVTELVEKDKAPVYLVHFSQRSCAESSQSLLSSNFCSKEEKKAIAVALHDTKFNSPYGKEVSKLLRHGVGIHHAGLLPKYRILVEKLAQKGLLKVICGTDTLGVGVNVPIRSVLFTKLCKYDGSGTKILSVRDFKQISGRAGRRGFDTIGYVVAQAPEHEIENLKLEAKAASSGKNKKIVKKKPPERGYVPWNNETFIKLQTSPPEPLVSSFKLRHNILLNVLSRKFEDGCTSLKNLIASSHENPKSQAKLRRQAREMFFALVRGGIMTILPLAERKQQKVQLHIDLQEDFTMNQALGLYLLDTIKQLDSSDPNYVLNLLSTIEAILEDPSAILMAQVNHLKSNLMADMKSEGVEYEERLERLDEVTHPMPGKDFIYNTFNAFKIDKPWLNSENVRPKSIVREMVEQYISFEDYIKNYKLERSEAVLLRHVSEVYKVLNQTIPQLGKTEEVHDAELYLKELIEAVDSSIIDEWNALAGKDPTQQPEQSTSSSVSKVPVFANIKQFTRNLQKFIFPAIKHLTTDNLEAFMNSFNHTDSLLSLPQLQEKLESFYDQHSFIKLDPEARNLKNTHLEQTQNPLVWNISQTLSDSNLENNWVLELQLTLESPTSFDNSQLQLVDLVSIA